MLFNLNIDFNLSYVTDTFLYGVVLSCFLVLVSYCFSLKNINFNKMGSYECGFIPFDDARSKMEIQFFIVALLFVIFDLEVVLILPWCSIVGLVTYFEFWVMFFFLNILIIGFLFEWLRGALT
jgi:NADH:ubiquinone oxidoreductase subunit 3 (subunit A)